MGSWLSSLSSASKITIEALAFPAPKPIGYNVTFNDFQFIKNVATIFHQVIGKLKKHNKKLIIIHSHGNATDIGYMNNTLNMIAKSVGIDIISYDYEGYGLTKGEDGNPCSPSEQGCIRSIRTVYDHLISEGRQPSDIILYGVSIGTGVTVDLAQKLSDEGIILKGILLQSPYTSVVGVISEMAAISSAYSAPEEYNPNILKNNEKIHKVKCPITIIHGTKDRVIPFDHAIKLEQLNNNIKLVPIVNAGHNGIEETYSSYIFNELTELAK